MGDRYFLDLVISAKGLTGCIVGVYITYKKA